jgi:hypothetical protein
MSASHWPSESTKTVSCPPTVATGRIGTPERIANIPIVAGFPFPLAVELLPAHLPLPAKIRTELLDPIEVDSDPDRVNDEPYVQRIYDEVHDAIQAGMTRLARKRRFPVFG